MAGAVPLMPQAQKPRFRRAILGPLSLVVATLVLALTAVVYWDVEAQNKTEVARIVAATKELLQLQQHEEAKAIEIALSGVIRDRAFAQPLRDGDREGLLRLAKPIFEPLQRDHGITHFYFSDIQRVILLRVHAPDKYGDVNNRFTELEAERNGSLGDGVEVGPFGALTLRAVMPYRIDDRVVGYVEMGGELGHSFDKVHDILGVNLLTLVDKRLVDPAFWGRGEAAFGWPFPLDRFPQVAITAHTLTDFPAELLRRIEGAAADGGIPPGYLHADGRTLYLTSLPLQDSLQQRVGSLLLLADFTEQAARSRRIMAGGALLCLSLGIGLMLLFLRIVRKVDREVGATLERLAGANADLERIAHVAVYQLEEPAERLARLGKALQERRPSSGEDDSGEMLAAIVRDGQCIRDAIGGIEDYLDLSVNAREMEPVALDAVLVAARERLQPLLRQSQMIASPLPVVAGHPLLLARAFLCLIENAFLSHAASRLEIHAEGEDGDWQIFFTDNGQGGCIAAGRMTETGPVGSCMAIAAVRRIAEMHGGGARMLYHPDRGTTVIVSLGVVPERRRWPCPA